jgi:hypothetical protein
MFHSTKALPMLSILLIVSCATKVFADDVDISGIEEMTTDEFLELVVGKTITGVHRSKEYTESYTHDGRFNGKWNGEPYNGRWKAGENNCVLILWLDRDPRCWKFLHKDGEYIHGKYTSDGTKLTMSHYMTFID